MKFGYNRVWETTMYLSHYSSKGLQTIMSTNARLQTHSRSCNFNLFGSFQLYDSLNLVRIPKYKYSLIKLRLSSHIPAKKRNAPLRTVQLPGQSQVIGQFILYQFKGMSGNAASHVFCNQASK